MDKVSIRYYSPYYNKAVHKQILDLLLRIKTKRGIDYEVKNVPKGGDQVIHKKDFVPKARVVKSRVGEVGGEDNAF